MERARRQLQIRSAILVLSLRAVGPQIEVMSATRDWRLSLEADRMTIGKSDENDVPLPDDPTASHLHAVLERFPAGWCVADLGSSERHVAERRTDLDGSAPASRRRDPHRPLARDLP